MAQTMSIKKAFRIVRNYCYALNMWKKEGKLIFPLAKKKQSIQRVIKAFKLYNVALNKEVFRMRTDILYYPKWEGSVPYILSDVLREVIELINANCPQILDYPILSINEYVEDFDEFIDKMQKLNYKDELFYDSVYAMIGFKKPIIFIDNVNFKESNTFMTYIGS